MIIEEYWRKCIIIIGGNK